MGAQHQLAFLATLDDQRFAAMLTRRGLFAMQQTFRRHAGDGLLLTVRAIDVPSHAGANTQRFIVLLSARDDEIVVAVAAEGDDSPRPPG